MTTEIAHIIARMSPVEMELYLELGGDLPRAVEREYLNRQPDKERCEARTRRYTQAIRVLAEMEATPAPSDETAEARRELVEVA